MSRRSARNLVAMALLAAPLASRAEAPAVRRGPAGFVCNVGGDVRAQPSRATLFWLGLGGAAALAVHSEDADIVDRLAGSHDLETALGAGEALGGELVLLPATFLTWGVGRWADAPQACQLAGGLLRAQLLAQVMTHGLKFSVQRQRPNGENRYSFPSGHTSGSFACATFLAESYGWKAGVPAYLFAAYVGMSRLTDRKHYPSDVLFGASIGIVAAHAVARHHPLVQRHAPASWRATAPTGWLDRVSLAPRFLPDGAGLVLIGAGPRYENCSPH